MKHFCSLARLYLLGKMLARLLLTMSLLFSMGGAARPAVAQSASPFPPGNHVLAQFDFNGSADDSSGNNRDGELLGGTFVPTQCGGGLRIEENTHGLDWSEFAGLLVHPYTIEMILTPESTNSYAKLFSPDDNNDSGWYYHMQGIRLFPNDSFGAGSMIAGEVHYLAFVSTAADMVDVYFQGERLGNGNSSFTAPPTQAIFFKDDEATGAVESLRGVVEALRISSTTRSESEIAAVQERLQGCENNNYSQALFMPTLRR